VLQGVGDIVTVKCIHSSLLKRSEIVSSRDGMLHFVIFPHLWTLESSLRASGFRPQIQDHHRGRFLDNLKMNDIYDYFRTL
jgi:hypothetical protein